MTNLLPPPLAASAFIIAKDLTLGLLAIGRGDLDLLDAVVAVSIVQSNVARVHADAEKDRRYEGGETLPPEESRQPVSVKAVANMLGLPFETVRRRIERLCARGVCARRRAGVVVPTSWLDSPAHRAAIAATEELVRTTFRRLQAVGFFDFAPLPTTQPADAPLPRLVSRSASDYFLRSAGAMIDELRDVTDAFLLMEILRRNTSHLPDARTAAWMLPSAFVPDGYKRPATMAEVARALRLGHECVRRHARKLQAEGLLARTDRGLIVPARALEAGPLRAMLARSITDMTRLFRTLARAGLTAAWAR